MGRRPRLHYPGAIYHVFQRGNGGKDVFRDGMDYQRFLDELSRLHERGLKFYSYCLMPNHFHLLVQVGETPLSTLMQIALARYSQYFNFRRATFGSVFQPRYNANLIDSNAYLLQCLRYMHLNPVSAGLAADAQDWKWSGHRGLLGQADQLLEPGLALGLFSDDPKKAKRMYLDFMCRREQADRPVDRMEPAASHDLETIASDAAAAFLIPVSELKEPSRRRVAARSRRLFVKRAMNCGFRRKEIAAFLGCHGTAVTKMLRGSDFSLDNSL